ncbi:hypothetical protein [[Clostridium] symbiosum]|nr:hypothetical protein [[Clostridium] symbiosum]
MSRILLFISCFFVYTGKARRKKNEERKMKKEKRSRPWKRGTDYVGG